MKCPRCSNTDPEYFYYGSKGWYCRKCIRFKRICVDDTLSVEEESIESKDPELFIPYTLTSDQQRISDEIVANIDKTDILVNAVTGAGKTEMTLGVIDKCLKEGKCVCYAIARRQVVLQIAQRLQSLFKAAKITPICSGYLSDLTGDVFVVTTHQLYRFCDESLNPYHHQIDVLILDEPDAFPFKGNTVLQNIAYNACKGHIVYLTATADAQLQKKVEKGEILELKLLKRPHGRDMAVPEVLVMMEPFLFIRLFMWIKENVAQAKILIFTATIAQMKQMVAVLSLFYKCKGISSMSENKEQLIDDFMNQKFPILVSTTILERGITIENVYVAVYHAEHKIFDESSLVQMAGRIGRTKNYPTGKGLFLCQKRSDEVKRCIERIQQANQS